MYHQIARNKRKSVVVVTAFFIIWAAIGYVIGYIASGVSGGISGVIIAAMMIPEIPPLTPEAMKPIT